MKPKTGVGKMAEEKKATITIDDKEYTEDELTDEQNAIINHIKSLQQKIASAQFNMDQLQVGRQAFVDMLKKSLEEPAPVDK